MGWTRGWYIKIYSVETKQKISRLILPKNNKQSLSCHLEKNESLQSICDASISPNLYLKIPRGVEELLENANLIYGFLDKDANGHNIVVLSSDKNYLK